MTIEPEWRSVSISSVWREEPELSGVPLEVRLWQNCHSSILPRFPGLESDDSRQRVSLIQREQIESQSGRGWLQSCPGRETRGPKPSQIRYFNPS